MGGLELLWIIPTVWIGSMIIVSLYWGYMNASGKAELPSDETSIWIVCFAPVAIFIWLLGRVLTLFYKLGGKAGNRNGKE